MVLGLARQKLSGRWASSQTQIAENKDQRWFVFVRPLVSGLA